MTEKRYRTDAEETSIAVVGMACRFAGGCDSPEAFWRMLSDGVDGIGELPRGRWDDYTADAANEAALRRTTRVGGFLDDIAGFDAEFFGLTPREAELMDPQQRIMLELAWQALEDAGIPPSSLAGGDTGVFMGVGSDDYGRRLLEDLPAIEAWTGIGSAMCAVANRISYALDLRGSSFAVDTACSASLVALHLAVQTLRAGETSLALVGGINVIAGPGLTMVLDAAGAISPDGRCKSFDASADGYGRGEGGGIVVLKRLADAERDGDRVLAVIRGSAVAQDGRTNGIMAPSGDAQAEVMRRAYADAGVDPATIDYVEAHGTGTRAGDPVEAGALSTVVGAGTSRDTPCLIGSVKPNIGHLEAGSGVAGVIKTVLALGHREIPPSLNCREPNPAIPWATNGLRVAATRTPWPDSTTARRAGVSSYGYGGTIAHVVLEEAPAPSAEPAPGPEGPRVVPVSGSSPNGLRANANRLADWLDQRAANGGGGAPGLGDVAASLELGRDHLTHRAAVVADDLSELVTGLRAVADDDEREGVRTDVAGPDGGTAPVWVFSGHGSQWPGMGRELLDHEPVFAAVVDELGDVFADELGTTPRAVLTDGPLSDVHIIQPMLFAIQVGLAALWKARGLCPSAVIGHSVGEIAAAVVGGILDRDYGARLVCRRSLLLRAAAGRGAMVMVDLPFAEAERLLAGRPGVTAAIDAGPSSTVVSGDAEAVVRLAEAWSAEGRAVRRVDSDVAFHSPHMDPLLADLAGACQDLTVGAPDIPVYSTALDDPRDPRSRDGAYWAANLRHPVRFTAAVGAAVDDGYRVFLEVSAHPVVAHSVTEVLAERDVDGLVVGTLRRRRPERAALADAVAALHCRGVDVDLGGGRRRHVALPSTAWQRRPYWRSSRAGARSAPARHDPAAHTLLGGSIDVAGSTPLRIWQTHVDEDSRPYPGHHPVHGTEIVPAAVLLATFLGARESTCGDGTGQDRTVAHMVLNTPVALSSPRDVQVTVQDGVLRLASRTAEDSSWLTHATASTEGRVAPVEGVLDLDDLRARFPKELPASHVTDGLAAVGVPSMGFGWTVDEVRRRDDGGLLGVVTTGEDDAATWGSVLDAAFSLGSVSFAGDLRVRMPAAVDGVTLRGPGPQRAVIAVTVSASDVVDVVVADPDGTVVARFDGLRYKVLDGDPDAVASSRRLVHEMVWRPAAEAARTIGTVALVGDDDRLAAAVAKVLESRGIRSWWVGTPERLEEVRLSGPRRGGDEDVVLVLPPATVLPDLAPVPAAATRHAWLVARTATIVSGLRWTPRVWALTSGVRECARPQALAQSAVWGAGRVIAGECPDLWGGVVDVDLTHPETPQAVVEALLGAPVGEVTTLRDDELSCARLVPVEREPSNPTVACRPDGTYLVTGGLGALGLEVAGWLVGRGARRIVLAGRRGLPTRDRWDDETDPAVLARITKVRALEARGASVTVVATDLADEPGARAALDTDRLGIPPIRGVVHAAGVLDNRLLRDLDEDSLRTVMTPKAAGAVTLDRLYPPGRLDFFVLFSSCGHLLGLPGQTSYGAANAFLDGFAHHRRARGGHETVSIDWTSWRGLGMSTSSELIDMELADRGTADVTTTEALRSWEYLDGFDLAQAAVLRILPLEPGATRPAVLEEIAVAESAPVETAPMWSDMAPDELTEALGAEVRHLVATEIRLDPGDLDCRRPLSEMGLDSVMTMVVRRRLEKKLHLTLPPTLLWNHPTVDAITVFLVGLITSGTVPAGKEAA